MKTKSARKISKSLADNRSDPRVSPVSRVHDLKWDFRPIWKDRSVPPNQKILNWEFKTSSGDQFSDAKFETLRHSAQNALAAFQRNEGFAQQPSTVKRAFIDLISLLRYMIDRRIGSFAAMTKGQASGYIETLMTSKLSPSRRYGRLKQLERLYELRLELTDTLRFNPFPDQSPFNLMGDIRAELRSRKTDVIPDEVAKDLVTKAAGLVANSKNLLDAYQAREEAESKRNGTSKASRDRARNRVAKEFGFTKGVQITKAITLLRTACLILIMFFTGVRKGEAASFRITSLTKDDDGYLWLHGRTTKLQKKDTKWMVPPIVEVAVKAAEIISRPMVAKLEQEEVWIRARLRSCVSDAKILKHKERLQEISEIKGCLFLSIGSMTEPSTFGNRVTVLTNTWDALRHFARAMDIRFEGKIWRLACHQFRRTFARFIAANLLNLRYLQEHFKHLALDMTAWYDVDDVEMTGLILEYYEAFKSKVLKNIMDKGVVAGKAATALKAEREEHYVGLVSQESKEEFVSSLSAVLSFKSTGISYCLGFRDKGLCAGVVGCMLDPSNVRKCDNAFVTEDFLPGWRAMEKRCISAIESPDLGRAEREIQINLLEETIRPIIEDLTQESSK
jgi:integrase